jgi:hypothetical protein
MAQEERVETFCSRLAINWLASPCDKREVKSDCWTATRLIVLSSRISCAFHQRSAHPITSSLRILSPDGSDNALVTTCWAPTTRVAM